MAAAAVASQMGGNERRRSRTHSITSQMSQGETMHDLVLQATAGQQPSPPCCVAGVLDPRSAFQQRWDWLILLLLIYTATVTPFDVAFLGSGVDGLFFVNRFVDLVFLADLVMQFNLGYLLKPELRTGEVKLGTDRAKFTSEYLRGYFFIDLISIFPFDVIGMILDDPNVSKLRVLRVLRLFRLFKLTKLLRSKDWVATVQLKYGFKYSIITLTQFMLAIFLVAHWLACLWYLVTKLEPEDTVTWVTVYFCNGVVTGCSISTSSLYCASLYYSTMTLTTIGYGDLTPQTSAETWVSVMTQLVGASMYAFSVGIASGIVASMNKEKVVFQETMDEMTDFMEKQELSDNLCIRMREYCGHLCRADIKQKYAGLLQAMSPALRMEVAMCAHGELLRSVSWLAPQGESFLTQVVLLLETLVQSPGEMVVPAMAPAAHLYFVANGVVVVASNESECHSDGYHWGEQVMMETGHHINAVRTLTFCTLYTVSRTALLSALEDFPIARKAIRRDVMKRAFRRDAVRVLGRVSNLEKTRSCSLSTQQTQLTEAENALRKALEASVSLQQSLAKRIPQFQRFQSHLINKKEHRACIAEMEANQHILATASPNSVSRAQVELWESRHLLANTSKLFMAGRATACPSISNIIQH